MHRRVDAHRLLVGVFAGDLLVDVEEIAVALPDRLLAETRDRVREIEINAAAAGPTPRPSSQASFALREEMSRGARLP
jgi:hypothetical protein